MHVLYNYKCIEQSACAQFSYMYLYELPTDKSLLHTHNTHIDYVIHVHYSCNSGRASNDSRAHELLYITNINLHTHYSAHAIAYASMRFVAEQIFRNITARNFHH